MANLFARKPIDRLMEEAQEVGEHSLKRSLGPVNLVGCAFAGLCYAEFASMIPVAGSAYTYSYATMGEFVAWIIGWDLILEYAVGAATVAIAWSEYFNRVLEWFGLRIPYQWS
ncbi:MAG: amino acid permease, partial [Candidatus Baltobacteraceae bacterium]